MSHLRLLPSNVSHPPRQTEFSAFGFRLGARRISRGEPFVQLFFRPEEEYIHSGESLVVIPFSHHCLVNRESPSRVQAQ